MLIDEDGDGDLTMGNFIITVIIACIWLKLSDS